jgi:hypothetical protein
MPNIATRRDAMSDGVEHEHIASQDAGTHAVVTN